MKKTEKLAIAIPPTWGVARESFPTAEATECALPGNETHKLRLMQDDTIQIVEWASDRVVAVYVRRTVFSAPVILDHTGIRLTDGGLAIIATRESTV